MKYDENHVSENVEDRRGTHPAVIGGGVGIGTVLLILIAKAAGLDISGLFGSDGGGSTTATSTAPDDPKLVHFVSYVVDDVNDTWAKILGAKYHPAKLVLFTDEIDTGCGRSSAAIGPFYCPPDEKAYIDLSFYAVLRDKLGADGDFAEAYVLAHEYGHHVQHILGADQLHDTRNNSESVRFELQADCYAGVWAHASNGKGELDPGDIEEAVNAAAQIGDDRLEKMAGQKVNPETFTHGTSAQRTAWFNRGYANGRVEDCDTFSGGP